jgi:hypothetical protein
MRFSYDRFGEHTVVEGMTWESDHGNTRTNCVNAAPVSPSIVINPANLPVGPSVSFEIVTADGIYVMTGFLDTTKPAPEVYGSLASQLGLPFTSIYNSPTNITLSTNLPGIGLTFSADGAVIVTTPSIAAATLLAGRLVVPDSDFLTTSAYAATPGIGGHTAYRYPALGDNAAGRIAAGIIVGRDWHTNREYGVNLDFSQGNTVKPGTVFTGFAGGSRMWLRPLQLLTTGTLFVETAVGANTGRLTSVASATTEPLPVGKFSPMAEILKDGCQRMRMNF